MGYKQHDPAVYVVGWAANEVIKAGFTCNQRWRKFILNGAELLSLRYFDTSTQAFAYEEGLNAALQGLGRRAFDDKTSEARDLLGSDCGGYAECCRVSPDAWPDFLAEHCSQALLLSIATQQWHGRTDETNARRSLSPTSATTSSVTRGRTYGFADE